MTPRDVIIGRGTTLEDLVAAGIDPGDAEIVIGVRDELAKGPVMCTGVSAIWCPVHGDCTCAGRDAAYPARADLNDEKCPLHGSHSNHAEI